jgi:hypothetical protein
LDQDGVVDSDDYDLFAYHFAPGIAPIDVNEDGVVDSFELSLVIDNFQDSVLGGIADGDMNLDGFIDENDFNIVGSYWGYGIDYAEGLPTPLSVPEPSSLTVLIVAIVTSRLRKRG